MEVLFCLSIIIRMEVVDLFPKDIPNVIRYGCLYYCFKMDKVKYLRQI